MFAIEVRDTIMVAHSLPDPLFGPAAGKHGATFVVDAAFFTENLTRQNTIIDIGRAQTVLKSILAPLHYKDLDTLPMFAGAITTGEFLCRYIHLEMSAAIRRGDLGDGADRLIALRITLSETPTARAWYEGPVVDPLDSA